MDLKLEPASPGIYTGGLDCRPLRDPTSSKWPARAAARRSGRDVLSFQREDGVAENFHIEQNRELLEKLSTQTGGRYYTPSKAGRLAEEISYSEAGISTRETRELWNMPLLFLLALALAVLGMAAAPEVGRRMTARLPAAVMHCLIVGGLGGEQEYEQRFTAQAQALELLCCGRRARRQVARRSTAPPRPVEHIRAALETIAKTAMPEDSVMVVLIGHGSVDGMEYKFNIPGPDLSATELALCSTR